MRANSSARPPTSYESYFGLREPPFGLAPNTRFRFDSASHQAALTELTYGLQRREPVLVVTGEIGTGKTLLCRTVVERLDRKTFLSTINDPLLGRDDLLKQMLQDFGVISGDRTAVAETSRPDLIHALNEFLLSLASLNAHAVVLIDEAQHLQPPVLEEIRLLSNLQDDRGTLLQMILVGQMGLESLLAKPELRQLKQRISRQVRLEPLSREEVAEYIAHRLDVARGDGQARERNGDAGTVQGAQSGSAGATPPVVFTPEAAARVAQLSAGIPRVVNLLCDRALESACAAASRVIDDRTIDAAARELQLADAPRPQAPEPPPHDDAVPDGLLVQTSGASRSPVWNVALAALVIVAVWLGMRSVNRTATMQTPPNAATPSAPSPAPTVAVPSSDTAPIAAAPPRANTTRDEPITANPASDGFDIVVASFRTTARATAVAADIAALGEPVRQRAASGWQQVLAGPFASRPEADDARERLRRAGFTDTQIVQAAR